MKTLERSYNRPAGPATPPITATSSPDVLEFTRAMQQYKHRSGRMFPTWSEILEVLLELGYRKPFEQVIATNCALLLWYRDGDEHTSPARLLDIGPNQAVVSCAGPAPPEGPARFCLLEPTPTRWADVSIAACRVIGMGPVQLELSRCCQSTAWGEILQSRSGLRASTHGAALVPHAHAYS